MERSSTLRFYDGWIAYCWLMARIVFFPTTSRYWARYLKPATYYKEQLKCRYLLAVEGNDVASGLKWMLASNSVVLMAPPRRETWLAESRLRVGMAGFGQLWRGLVWDGDGGGTRMGLSACDCVYVCSR